MNSFYQWRSQNFWRGSGKKFLYGKIWGRGRIRDFFSKNPSKLKKFSIDGGWISTQSPGYATGFYDNFFLENFVLKT